MNRLAMLGILTATLAACGTDDGTDDGSSSLTIHNESSFTLIELNLSPTTEVRWGADLLGSDVLAPGDVLELSSIDCGTYDIRVIDETSDECILDAVDLCLSDAVWRIDDAELASCGF